MVESLEKLAAITYLYNVFHSGLGFFFFTISSVGAAAVCHLHYRMFLSSINQMIV